MLNKKFINQQDHIINNNSLIKTELLTTVLQSTKIIYDSNKNKEIFVLLFNSYRKQCNIKHNIPHTFGIKSVKQWNTDMRCSPPVRSRVSRQSDAYWT